MLFSSLALSAFQEKMIEIIEIKALSAGGGIGRRTSLRGWRVTPYEFESHLAHLSTELVKLIELFERNIDQGLDGGQ